MTGASIFGVSHDSIRKTQRIRFVIAPDSKVAAVLSPSDDKVSLADHVTKSLEAVKRLAPEIAMRTQRSVEGGCQRLWSRAPPGVPPTRTVAGAVEVRAGNR